MIGFRGALVALAVAGLIAAGCGDDDETGEEAATTLTAPGGDQAAALQEEIADLGDDEQIAAVGEEWADRFGDADETMCGYLHPDLGTGPSTCATHVDGSLTQSSQLQASFAGATVESVEVEGETALAEFSNGHRVRFARDPDGAWKVVETPRSTASGAEEVVEPG